MPLSLHVDAAAWQRHLHTELAASPGLVPVVKGNGYGFTNPLLVRTAAGLGVSQVAVGTAEDAALALATFGGEVIVLQEPQNTSCLPADPGGQLLCTAGSVIAAGRLAGLRRLIVDCRTSLRRQGIAMEDLARLAAVTGGGRAIEAFALHLPIDRPRGTDPAAETAAWVRALSAAKLPVRTLYVSHLEPAEMAALAAAFPATQFRLRSGTRLWLGCRPALRAAATVLEVAPVARGERLGYRQRRSWRNGWLVIAAGGTAHGVGLEPSAGRRGARTLARAGLAAAGQVRSPFSCWDGRRLWFAEPPHMLVSMLLLPGRGRPPVPGTELDVQVRYTLTRFDRVSLSTASLGLTGAGTRSGRVGRQAA